MLNISNSAYRRIEQIFFATLLVVVFFTFRHYGITWDEELQSQYGIAVVDYYFSGFQDLRYADIFNLYFYGGMFDGFASLVDRFTPFSVYDTRHFLNALFGVLGIWGTARLARFIGGNVVGLLAIILLVLTPVYYGHMFNNPKDIPFATGIVWSIYFMSRCIEELPRPKWSLVIKLSIILGLTLGVRVGGFMLMAFWFVPLGLWALIPLMQKPFSESWRLSVKNLITDMVRLLAPVAIIAYIVMLICWPWAQQSPIANPLRAISEFSNFPQDVEVLLNGTIYRSTQLPWFYVPVYFAIQLPEFILVLLAGGLLALPLLWKSLASHQKQSLILIMLMALVPTGYAVFHHPALYDAVRHFLFVIPLLCIFGALAAHRIVLWAVSQFILPWSRRLIMTGFCIVSFLFVMTQTNLMLQLHPYEYIYANQITGGVHGAYGNYELDYWGTSFKEAAHDIQELVNKEGGVPAGKIYRIAICGPWAAAMINLPPDYQAVVANEPAEFFLSTTRWMCQNMRPGREVIRIERMGVPLAIVKDLRS